MEGRECGEKGGQLAARYIASKFQEWRLGPAFEERTYIQDFIAEHSKVEENLALKLKAGKIIRDFYYGEDWHVWNFSGSDNFTTEVAFVGYGIHAPQKRSDDYAGVDLKGKPALLVMGIPPLLEDKLKEEAEMQQRIKAAQEVGAREVLFCSNPAQRTPIPWRLKKEIYKPDFVILYDDDKIGNFIFKEVKLPAANRGPS